MSGQLIMNTKTERIDVRTTAAAKQLLQQAAATSHKSVSEFLLENGLRQQKQPWQIDVYLS